MHILILRVTNGRDSFEVCNQPAFDVLLVTLNYRLFISFHVSRDLSDLRRMFESVFVMLRMACVSFVPDLTVPW